MIDWCFRFFGLVGGLFFGFIVLVIVSSSARAAYPNESAAYSACMAYTTNPSCPMRGVGVPQGSSECAPALESNYYYEVFSGSTDLGRQFHWCVPAQCNGGWDGGADDGSLSWSTGSGNQDTTDDQNCCVSWVQQRTWTYDGVSGQDGYYKRTGGYCAHAYSASSGPSGTDQPTHQDQFCDTGAQSCYNPQNHQACYATDSGEQICADVGPSAPGGCISGATGSTCVGANGSPPPPPPDPPIQKNASPSSTDQLSSTDTSSGATNNTTINNYSGTSPGPGPTSSSAPASSGGATGSQSNANGGGNSGKNGTDSNGKCPSGNVPTASGCSGTYSDQGCDTPPQCYGDAVLCGIAREDHYTRCGVQKLAAASASSTGIPSGMGDGTDNTGDPTSSAVSNTVDLGDTSKLDSGGFGYATTCPLTDGIHFTFLGNSIHVDTSDMCAPLSFIYYLVLAFAYFTAAKIMAGVK